MLTHVRQTNYHYNLQPWNWCNFVLIGMRQCVFCVFCAAKRCCFVDRQKAFNRCSNKRITTRFCHSSWQPCIWGLYFVLQRLWHSLQSWFEYYSHQVALIAHSLLAWKCLSACIWLHVFDFTCFQSPKYTEYTWRVFGCCIWAFRAPWKYTYWRKKPENGIQGACCPAWKGDFLYSVQRVASRKNPLVMVLCDSYMLSHCSFKPFHFKLMIILLSLPMNV